MYFYIEIHQREGDNRLICFTILFDICRKLWHVELKIVNMSQNLNFVLIFLDRTDKDVSNYKRRKMK